MSYPTFAVGDVLAASDMNAVGLWLVKTQTVGTGVSDVTVTGAFSATYDAYKIIYSGGSSSAGGAIQMTLGTTTTGYAGSIIYQNTATPGTIFGLTSGTAGAAWVYPGSTDTTSVYFNVDLINPFLAEHTYITGQYIRTATMGTFQGSLADTTSYTSFKLDPEGVTTLTGGTIRVYGYRN